ncbi:MAG: ribose ABC transporter permease [Proteobacteria bacterium]|nr:ribose ABC transporter permease [Pseudomonadota bacterium]
MPPGAEAPGRRPASWWQRSQRTAVLLPVLLFLCLGFAFADATFVTATNVTIVLQQASITGVLAAGMTVVVLTGGLDLSVGSILALSATAALIVSFVPYLGMLGIVAGLATGVLLGCLNGWAIATTRLPPVLITLASFAVLGALAHLLGVDEPFGNPRLPFAFIGNGAISGVPLLVVIAVCVVLLVWIILRRTTFGARIRAVGGGRDATKPDDAEVFRVQMVVYATSGLLAGLGGVMSAARLFSANTVEPGQSYALDAIAAVVLGGTRLTGGVAPIWGAAAGSVIIAVLTDGLVLAGASDANLFIVKVLIIIGVLALDHYRLGPRARG